MAQLTVKIVVVPDAADEMAAAILKDVLDSGAKRVIAIGGGTIIDLAKVIAVLNRLKLGTKMGLVSEAMFADCAVLIPELLTTLPLKVFATSSIDALVHAVESALSPKATPFTKILKESAGPADKPPARLQGDKR